MVKPPKNDYADGKTVQGGASAKASPPSLCLRGELQPCLSGHLERRPRLLRPQPRLRPKAAGALPPRVLAREAGRRARPKDYRPKLIKPPFSKAKRRWSRLQTCLKLKLAGSKTPTQASLKSPLNASKYFQQPFVQRPKTKDKYFWTLLGALSEVGGLSQCKLSFLEFSTNFQEVSDHWHRKFLSDCAHKSVWDALANVSLWQHLGPYFWKIPWLDFTWYDQKLHSFFFSTWHDF